MKTPLIKREYLGEGNFHLFKNKKSEEITTVWCTNEEYGNLSLAKAENPTLEGCTWVSSSGGAAKVDSPTGLLSEGEFYIKDGLYWVFGKMEVYNEEEFNKKYTWQ